MSKNIIREVIKAGGGATKISKVLRLKSRQAIYMWDQIPSKYLIKLEKLTSIPRQKLRPDLYE